MHTNKQKMSEPVISTDLSKVPADEDGAKEVAEARVVWASFRSFRSWFRERLGILNGISREKSARVAVIAAPEHPDGEDTEEEEEVEQDEEVDDPDILSDLPDDMEVFGFPSLDVVWGSELTLIRTSVLFIRVSKHWAG